MYDCTVVLPVKFTDTWEFKDKGRKQVGFLPQYATCVFVTVTEGKQIKVNNVKDQFNLTIIKALGRTGIKVACPTMSCSTKMNEKHPEMFQQIKAVTSCSAHKIDQQETDG